MAEAADRQQLESYRAKDESYYSNARHDYVALLPDNPRAAILELGCGNGATGALAFQQGKCATYVGIEMFEPMADRAREVLTTVHVGNVETMDLPYGPNTFDALIASEVMEHLVDPYATLARLTATLKPGAKVFASSPNVAHWRNVLALAQGRFRYTESGMMDRTHLRWFTPESFREMFEQAGVAVDRVAPLNSLRKWERVVSGLFPPLGPTMFFQINLHGHYRGSPAG